MQPSPEILNAIPHRPPFLYVDTIVERKEDGIVCRKTFEPDEYFFAGHYPDFPIVPGVILCEAAMQAGAVFLSEKLRVASCELREESTRTSGFPVATRINDVKFKKMVRPGDTIEITVTLKEKLSNAYFLSANVTVDGKTAARLEFAVTVASFE
ncbi:MAG: beta-hydroxyacyl-ACP dehydratase [Thermoguttaceae bacterium]|nr:beta-hydroxyacyl-ACP dehydratase [Thermoguttaceae bacterium]